MKLIILTILLSFSIQVSAKVVIIKQWHLSPKDITLNIEDSKKKPQYTNQKDIYDYLKSNIKKKNINLVISEGCEGNIDKGFKESHNGWNYKKLSSLKEDKKYSDILALVPLKIKVYFENEIKVLCGDSLKLMKENSLAFSELRGYANFSIALIQNKKNKSKFDAYKKALMSGEKNPKKLDAISFAKLKASQSLAKALELIKKRNDSFIEKIIENKKDKVAVVIGGMHVQDLTEKLKKMKIPFEVYTPKGYKNIELELLSSLNKFLK